MSKWAGQQGHGESQVNDTSTTNRGRRDELQNWLRFIRAESHILRKHPQLRFQQAANQADDSHIAARAKARWDSGMEARPWLQWLNKSHRGFTPESYLLSAYEAFSIKSTG